MTDEELYQQIEEYREESQAVYERIHEQVEASIVKHARAKKRRKKFLTGIASVAAVVIVVLAIVLPITLQPQSQEQEFRYSDADVLISDELDCNLKEYYAVNSLSLLYLDWYKNAEYLFTERYYEEGKESETVYLTETIIDGNTGYTVEISVMKRNIVVESFDERFEEYETMNIDNTQVAYILNKKWSLAKFEYQGYKYYLKINYGTTLEFLVETIESMFNN